VRLRVARDARAGPGRVSVWQTAGVEDLPRRAAARTVKLAGLPIGYAGRATLGLGKRLGGRPAEVVAAEVQARTAEQLFKVLGELKGGAMKFGQAMSVFEAALPENLAGPYRETLTRLQESAPPLPARTVHTVLSHELGTRWRDRFQSFEDRPAAAASIGQVHRAVWADGRDVAVKVQYPGAGDALLSDLTQIGRMSRLVGLLVPGLDVKPLVAELKARVAEELDYTLEASNQAAFAAAFAGDPDILVPVVVDGSERVLVSEWVDGTPLSQVIAGGSTEQRDRAGLLLARFLFSGPQRAGLLHADPHPGNFRLRDDGRLAVLDYGAVNRLPDGLPTSIGPLLERAIAGDADGVLDGLRREGFVRPGISLDASALLGYLGPILEPARAETFRFSRSWLRSQAVRVGDPRSPAYSTGLQLNLPPDYLLIHRVTTGAIGVLCQLEAEARWRAELETWLPGFGPDQPATRPARRPAKRPAGKRPKKAGGD
jgi:predicted unusual protein kinase regulating ubiquinone biosynthesis (AarF/ABC1/UbiB family)